MADSLLNRLRSALQKGDNFSKGVPPRLSLNDASDLCKFLSEQAAIGPLLVSERWGSYQTPLCNLVMSFQQPEDKEAQQFLRQNGLPELVRLCDLALAELTPPADPLTMMAKMFALYGDEPGVQRVAAIARRFPDEFMLSVSFQSFGDERHPHGPALIDLLREPLPSGFACVLTLDLANTLSRQKRLVLHPFDTTSGHATLEKWLRSSDPGEFSYAVSSAACLPFIRNDAVRNRLAALAMDHMDPNVQMEAAWASAFCGSEAGLKFLVRQAADVRYSVKAMHYLEELGKRDSIPERVCDLNFQALAEMSNWLAHPNEFGSPPTSVEIFDTRELYWPPTDDTRRVWLVRYRYANHREDGKDEIGTGMVGSVTFALFGDTKSDLSAEDVYGLHCCWELEGNGDKRAPRKRSAAAGRKLLGI